MTAKRALSPEYYRYMRSPSWLQSPARLEELRLSGGLCRGCNLGEPEVRITVHHRTYARFTCEQVGDLTTLCEDCHKAVTANIDRRRQAARRARGHRSPASQPPHQVTRGLR